MTHCNITVEIAPISRRTRALPAFSAPVILAVILAAVLSGCGDRLSIDEQIAAAQQSIAAGHHRLGIITYKNILSREPGRAEVRLALAEAYLDLSLLADASKELDKAAQMGMAPAALVSPRVRLMLELGDTDGALEQLEQAPESGRDPDLVALRGAVLAARDEESDARAAFERALELEADNELALLGLANLHLPEDRRSALKVLDRLLDAHPESAPGWLARGTALLFENDHAPATAAYQRAAEIFPDSAEAQIGLAKTALARKDFEAAQAHVDVLSRLVVPGPLVDFYKGLIAYEREDFDTARAQFLEVLKSVPDHRPSLVRLGTLEFQQGNYEQALLYLRTYLNITSEHWEARQLLASAHQAVGETANAVRVLLETPVEAVDPSELALNLARAYSRNGEYAQAAELYRSVLERGEKLGTAHLEWAGALIGAGASESGLEILNEAARLDELGWIASPLLAAVQIRMGELTASVETAERMVEEEPGSPIAWNLLGVAKSYAGEFDAAREAFGKARSIMPDHVPSTVNFASMEFAQGNRERAAELVDAFMAEYTEAPPLLVLLAKIRDAEGDVEAAVKLMERAKAAEVRQLDPYAYLWFRHFTAANYERALEEAEDARKRFPKEAAVYSMTALARYGAGDVPGAVEALTNLTGSDSQLAGGHLLRARLHIAAGKLDAAKAAVTEAESLGGTAEEVAVLRAYLHLKEGEPTAALAVATGLLETSPDAVEALALAATASLQIGEVAAATAYAQRYLELRPDSAQALGLIAEVTLRSGQVENAENAFLDVIERSPDDAFALLNLTRIALEKGDEAAFAEYFERAVKTNARSPGAMLMLANLAHRAGALKRAALLAKGIRDYPNLRNVDRLKLAKLFLLLGIGQESYAIAKKLHEDAPGHTETTAFLVALENARLNFKEARSLAQSLLATDADNADAYYQLAVAAAGIGDFAASITAAERAVELGHANPKLRIVLVESLLAENRVDDAIAVVDEYRRRWKDDSVGDYLQAQVHARQGNLEQARELYERVLARSPLPGLVVRVAEIEWAAGERERAKQRLRDWLDERPEDLMTRRRLADFHLVSGDYPAAIKELETVTLNAPTDIVALNRLAWSYGETNDKRALSTIEKAAALAPDDPAIGDTYGWLLLEAGRANQAVQVLAKAYGARDRLPPQDAATLRYHYALAQARSGARGAAVNELQALLNETPSFPEAEVAREQLARLRATVD